ncbi:MAG TPA: DsrE family protein [Puia sp.]|nr:DsrE family protein [Puia sp.]
MRNILIVVFLYAVPILSSAQNSNKISSDSTSIKDSLRMAKFFSMAAYPVIKDSKWSGVVPVSDIQEKPDSLMKFKLLMEVTNWSSDSASKKEINSGLAEVGRLINLHIAAGVPLKNIEAVVVVHAGALNALLNNEAYREKFNTDNPNLHLLQQFEKLGVKLITCGQAMVFLNFDRKDIIPYAKTALTAQVVLSNYQLKGFVLYKITDEK